MSILQKNTGFTFIEILISVSILIIGLLGMVSVTVMVIKGNSFSKSMTTATTMVNAKLEDLKNASFTGGSLSGGDHTDADNPLSAIYTRTWNVADTMNGSGTRITMKTVTVKVSWLWSGKTRNVTMKTIVANPHY